MPSSDHTTLSTVESLVREIGRSILALPPPSPFRTAKELRAVFGALDEPLAARMRTALQQLRPQAVWAEEMHGRIPREGEVWVVDALDGAIQYLQGLTQWCVSVTLVRDSVPVLAVLHSPILGETYSALAGGGATRNGSAIHPAEKTELQVAYVGCSQPPFVSKTPRALEQAGTSLTAVLRVAGAVRNLGATSWQVADVASGRLDAFWEYGADDVNLLGAVVIAREAGARVTDAAGNPWTAGATSIVVSAPQLHSQLLAVMPEP